MILVQSITAAVWSGEVGFLALLFIIHLICYVIINTLCAVPGALLSMFNENDDSNEVDLQKQINELQDKIKSAKLAKERQEKEKRTKELARQGNAQAQFELAKSLSAEKFKEALEWLGKQQLKDIMKQKN
jgi:hypothetical protein